MKKNIKYYLKWLLLFILPAVIGAAIILLTMNMRGAAKTEMYILAVAIVAIIWARILYRYIRSEIRRQKENDTPGDKNK